MSTADNDLFTTTIRGYTCEISYEIFPPESDAGLPSEYVEWNFESWSGPGDLSEFIDQLSEEELDTISERIIDHARAPLDTEGEEE